MPGRNGLITTLLAAAIIAAQPVLSDSKPIAPQAPVAAGDAKPDYAPIVERKLDFYSFTYETPGGSRFDLCDYDLCDC